jgi:hypothetical protein
MRTTKNQSIIRKQKMQKIYVTYFKTFQQTPTNCSWDHTVQGFHHKNKQKGDKGSLVSNLGSYWKNQKGSHWLTPKTTQMKYNELSTYTTFPQSHTSNHGVCNWAWKNQCGQQKVIVLWEVESGLWLRGESLCLVLWGVVFSEGEKRRGWQDVVDPFQKGFVWC